MIRLAALTLALLAIPVVAKAGKVIPGPILAEGVSVYDGDTLAQVYPDERPAPTFYWQRGEPKTKAGIGR